MSKQPRIILTKPAIEELLRACDEMLSTISNIRYSTWSKAKALDGTNLGTFLRGIDLNAEELDEQLIGGEAIIRRVRRQARELKP